MRARIIPLSSLGGRPLACRAVHQTRPFLERPVQAPPHPVEILAQLDRTCSPVGSTIQRWVFEGSSQLSHLRFELLDSGFSLFRTPLHVSLGGALLLHIRLTSPSLLLLPNAAKTLFFLRTDPGRMLALLARHFPFREGAGKVSDVRIVQDPHTRAQRPKQSTVVAHENDGPLVALDRILYRLD